ncbi:MAG TPA: PAS domain-containing protein [Methanospirillum sp.]|nr:PAS domain-containing protein [Methanospirillum sp.]
MIKSQDISTLQRIIDEIPCAILIINTTGTFIECNKAALTLFRIEKPEDILGKNPDIISPQYQRNGKESEDMIRELVQKAQEEGSVSFYWDHKRMNGEIFPAKVMLSMSVYEGQPCILASIVDITGQVLIEEKDALVNGNPYAIIVLNPDLTIAEVNPAFSRISGYTQEEWISKNLSELSVIRRDGPTADEAIKSKKTVTGKAIVDFPTGIHHMEYSYIPVVNAQGEILKIYDVLADLTEITEQLHGSKTLINENPTSIITTDLKGKILQINKAFLNMTRMPEEQLLTMYLSDFNLISREGTPFSEVLSSKKPGNGSMIADFGDRIKVLEYTYIPVLDVNNTVQKIISVYADVTEQKTYIEENKKFISENPYAIFTLDLDSRITDANPAFSTMSGYSSEELLKMRVADFHVLHKTGPTAGEIIKTGKTGSGTMIVDFPAGIRHVENVYIPIKDPRGTVYKIIEIFADQTHLVDQLHESETLITENPTSIITTDLKGKILQVNKAFSNMTQMPEAQLLTMKTSDFTLISREGTTFSEVLSSKKPGNGSMIADFGDRIKVLEYTYIPVLDVNDTIQKVISVYADLTEQKTYIEENKAFLSQNPYAIFTMDLNYQITDVNPAFSKMSGYQPEELLKMKLQDFNVIKKNGPSAADAIRSGKLEGGNLVVQFPTGIRHVDFYYIPIKDARGNVHKLIELFSDQTNLVEKLLESETLVNESLAGIITTDLNGTILSSNQAFQDITQLSDSKLKSMNIRDIKVVEREGAQFGEIIAAKKAGTGTITIDLGSITRILNYSYIPILDANNTVTKMVLMYSDITTIKKMVAYLEQSIGNLYENLSYLSHGNTSFTATVIDADQQISGAQEQFVRITQVVNTAREAIANLVRDSTLIASAALAGDISFRVDQTVHEGDYRKIIEGMNQTQATIEIPVREAMRIAKEYAGYNFTARFDRKQEIKGDWISFRSALDEIGDKIAVAISTINSQVKNLSANADEAHGNVGEIAEGAGQMANSATQVSTNADQGNFGVQQILKAMEDLTITVGDVSKKTEEVSEYTKNSNDLAKEGTDLAKKAEEGMQVITVSAEDMNRLIGEIQQDMKQIGKIVRLISDIASQTNLLALNAAIEAARAGEAGRGFAVVAAEVKSLATESRTSAENIAEMITSLQKKSEDAGNSAYTAQKAIQEGNVAMSDTLKVFGKMAESVEGISMHIEQVAAMSEEQASSVEEVTASINEISNMLEGNSQGAGEIAQITKQSAASIDELKQIIKQVNGGASEVSKAVASFKV